MMKRSISLYLKFFHLHLMLYMVFSEGKSQCRCDATTTAPHPPHVASNVGWQSCET